MKLCKNCIHYRWFIIRDLSKCKSPNRPTDVSPITGVIKFQTVFCGTARKEWEYLPMCGPEARWFESK